MEIGGFTPIIRSPPVATSHHASGVIAERIEDQKNYPLGFVKCLFNDSNDAEYSSIPLEEGTYAKRSWPFKATLSSRGNVRGDDPHEDQISEHSLCSNIEGETVVNE